MSHYSTGRMFNVLKVCTQIFGLTAISRKPLVYFIHVITWLVLLALFAYRMFFWYQKSDDNSIKGLVEITFYTMQIATNMVVVLEAYINRHGYQNVQQMYDQVLRKMHNHPDPEVEWSQMYKRINRKLSLMYVVAVAGSVPKFFSFTDKPNWRAFFWYSLISEQALQVRLLQLIGSLMIISERLDVLRGVLEKAAEKIGRQVKCVVWMPSSDEECKLVVSLRCAYDQFYDLSLLLNDYYGWSILTIAGTYCFEFVSKAYRIFTVMQEDMHNVKLVTNAATTIGLAVFITTMCWLGHDCYEKTQSLLSHANAFTARMTFLLSKHITNFVLFHLDFAMRFFGLVPLTTISMVFEMFLLCWIAVLLTILALMFINNEMSDDYTIGSLVSGILFITQILSHIIALGESYFSASKTRQLNEGFEHIDRIFRLKLQYTLDPEYVRKVIAREMLWMHTILIVDTLIMTYTHEATRRYTVLYWYSFLSCQAFKLRCTQLVMLVICINVRLEVVQKVMLDMVRVDAKRRDMVALATEDNTECVASLKMAYSHLNKMVNLVNDSFGWSLVSMCTSYFIDFITNCYWLFMCKFTRGSSAVYILNGGPVVSLALQLTVICWHCQQCENYSRCIGCSICKLSKPMGNKRYNDLVSEFSLQALHQSFTVTAKDFFVLNLDLLRGMAGAIVTYLVILIQFMFTERSGSKITVPNSSAVGEAANVVLKNQTNKIN